MFDKEALLKELDFKAVISGGPGGQHANKTATKVELYWNVEKTGLFSAEETARLLKNLKPRLTKENMLILSNSETRSQHTNRKQVTEQFWELLENALKVPKTRKKTKPSKAAKEKRLRDKKEHSEKKNRRKGPGV